MGDTVAKVYADGKNLLMFVCPNCSRVREEETGRYKGAKGPVKIDCPCGQSYEVEIEFRKFYRKGTRLEGTYFSIPHPGAWGKMTLKNVSMEGCGFETTRANKLNPDEEIRVEFQLDDVKNSRIKKRAVVRSVFKNYVGCKFQEPPGAVDPDLGFYLRRP